jgi:hypothetical protein
MRNFLLASLSMLSDAEIVRVLAENTARDYDGSQFQVASLSDIHAWRVKAADKDYFRGHVAYSGERDR